MSFRLLENFITDLVILTYYDDSYSYKIDGDYESTIKIALFDRESTDEYCFRLLYKFYNEGKEPNSFNGIISYCYGINHGTYRGKGLIIGENTEREKINLFSRLSESYNYNEHLEVRKKSPNIAGKLLHSFYKRHNIEVKKISENKSWMYINIANSPYLYYKKELVNQATFKIQIISRNSKEKSTEIEDEFELCVFNLRPHIETGSHHGSIHYYAYYKFMEKFQLNYLNVMEEDWNQFTGNT